MKQRTTDRLLTLGHGADERQAHDERRVRGVFAREKKAQRLRWSCR